MSKYTNLDGKAFDLNLPPVQPALRYNATKPTAPGFYFCHSPEGPLTNIVRVERCGNEECPWDDNYFEVEQSGFENVPLSEWPDTALWAGPITEPLMP